MNSIEHETRVLLLDIEKHLKINHLTGHAISRNWRTHNQKRSSQIKKMMIRLKPIIERATAPINAGSRRGRKQCLNLDQKVTMLLLKQLLGKSSRSMASMTVFFSSISGNYLGYKTIERLYSDAQTHRALSNLKEILLSER